MNATAPATSITYAFDHAVCFGLHAYLDHTSTHTRTHANRRRTCHTLEHQTICWPVHCATCRLSTRILRHLSHSTITVSHFRYLKLRGRRRWLLSSASTVLPNVNTTANSLTVCILCHQDLPPKWNVLYGLCSTDIVSLV